MSQSMNDPESNVNPEANTNPGTDVSRRIEEFLRSVEGALGEGGMAADERQNIAADLRVQIEEMLAQRAQASGKAVSLEDVEAVLAALDPPESYSEAAHAREPEKVAAAADSGQDRQQTREQWRPRGHWGPRGRGCGPGGFGPGGFGPGGFGRGPRWFWGKRHVMQAIRQAIHGYGPFGNPMFAGMTERTRTAISLAKTEARNMRHEYIGTEHLLLGLSMEGTGLAARVLNRLGLDRQWIGEEARRLVPPGPAPVTQERLPLTPRARQAIEGARLAARQLGHDFLGTEHLLLGLLDVPGVGAQIVFTRGVTRDQVREEIMKEIAAGSSPRAPSADAPKAGFTYWPASATQAMKIGANTFKLIAAGSDTSDTYSAVEASYAGPDTLGPRVHGREDLSLYVLEGDGQLRVGDRTLNLGKGDFARVPRGTAHEVLPGAGGMKAMIIATPGGVEKMLAELSAATEAASHRDIAAKFGVTLK
jgi:mannose-6-phosphate isomerase-like protein (cupin superfamily)